MLFTLKTAEDHRRETFSLVLLFRVHPRDEVEYAFSLNPGTKHPKNRPLEEPSLAAELAFSFFCFAGNEVEWKGRRMGSAEKKLGSFAITNKQELKGYF